MGFASIRMARGYPRGRYGRPTSRYKRLWNSTGLHSLQIQLYYCFLMNPVISTQSSRNVSHFLFWDLSYISLKCPMYQHWSLLVVSKVSEKFPLFYSIILFEYTALETKCFPSISSPNVVLHSLSGQACIEEPEDKGPSSSSGYCG